MIPILLILQLVLGAVLMWCSFCRLVKTDNDTHREVRWAFIFELVASGLVFGAPVMPMLMPDEVSWASGETPYWVWIALLASFAFIQLTTAVHWATGKVPQLFQRRRAEDTPTPFYTGWPLAAVGSLVAIAFVIGPVAAFAQAAEKQWDPVQAEMYLMADGQEFRCATEGGCLVMTPGMLKALLAKANGMCGRLPGRAA